MHNVISYHAITDHFKDEIMRESGSARFTAVGKLRNLGLLALLREIRLLKADLMTIAIEHDSARPLAGPLAVLAVLSGSTRIRIHWPDGQTDDVTRRRAASQIYRIIADQVRSRVALRAAAREVKRLDQPDPSGIAAGQGNTVLYLDANLSFGVSAGGSVGHTRGVIDGLIGAGFAVDYASVKTMPTDTTGAAWHQVPSPSLYGFPPELNYYLFNSQYESFVEELVRQRPYAFLYQRMSLHNFSGARLRNHFGIPFVLEYNGSEAWAFANWGEPLALHDIAVAAERVALRNADLVVTVSDVLGQEVAAAGVPAERIVVYPNCIDPVIFAPDRFSAVDRMELRIRWNIPTDALVASFIGTFGTWHGVDFLAAAIRQLVEQQRNWLEDRKLHFLLIGDGLKMAEVRDILDGEPFSTFVTLTGLVAQSDAPAYLAASDIFLATHVPNTDGTAFFGSPTKLFEYMAMERPIVAADLDQIGAVLRGKGKAPPLAKLFVPGSQEGFIQALRQLVDDPEGAAAMARRARSKVMAKYTWEHHVGAILERARALGLDARSHGITRA